MLRVGLTGGIGSGKSTVGEMLAAQGAVVVDADAQSRAVTAPGGEAIGGIAAAFGSDFITDDGALDRARMRALAFTDPGARRRLEAIVHPLVGQRIAQAQADAQAAGARWIVFDVPLLVESGRWRQQVDRVLVVDCSPGTQIRRVMARSQLDEAAVKAIIEAQAPRALRLAAADAVLCNDDLTLDALRAEVARLTQCFGL